MNISNFYNDFYTCMWLKKCMWLNWLKDNHWRKSISWWILIFTIFKFYSGEWHYRHRINWPWEREWKPWVCIAAYLFRHQLYQKLVVFVYKIIKWENTVALYLLADIFSINVVLIVGFGPAVAHHVQFAANSIREKKKMGSSHNGGNEKSKFDDKIGIQFKLLTTQTSSV